MSEEAEDLSRPTFTVTERYLVVRALLPRASSITGAARSHNIRSGFELSSAEREKMGVPQGAETFEITRAMEETVEETDGDLSRKELEFLADCAQVKSEDEELPNNPTMFSVLKKLAPYSDYIQSKLEDTS